jgi:hypothetical protein
MSMAWQHPRVARRTMLQAGSLGLVGLGVNHLMGLREAAAAPGTAWGFGNAGDRKGCPLKTV